MARARRVAGGGIGGARVVIRPGDCAHRGAKAGLLALFMRPLGALFSAPVFIALFFALSLCAAAQPPTIAVLDFEIEDDTVAQGGVSDVPAQKRRLDLVATITRQGLAEGGALDVVDNGPAEALIARTRALQALHTCNGCELDIALALGADLVLVGWVQKVSNLILNLNAGIKDVGTGRTLLVRSVDMRGNTDTSWARAARRLAQEIRETLPARLVAQPVNR
jgi:hypothetical protein